MQAYGDDARVARELKGKLDSSQWQDLHNLIKEKKVVNALKAAGLCID